MHGARAGAPKGEANGAWRHGLATDAAIAAQRVVADMVREAAKIIAAMRSGRLL